MQNIQNRIYEIRGHRVMLDYDLAEIYEAETRVLNQAVKRNSDRFPDDFMFRLNKMEWEALREQIANTAGEETMSSQFVMTYPGKRPATALPYAFTEHGVAMLASVLKSKRAIKMNIAIVRAFIALRQVTVNNHEILNQLMELRDRIGEHDVQLKQIYDSLENLLDKQSITEKWEERKRIGFKK
jgi:ORF6N domain